MRPNYNKHWNNFIDLVLEVTSFGLGYVFSTLIVLGVLIIGILGLGEILDLLRGLKQWFLG